MTRHGPRITAAGELPASAFVVAAGALDAVAESRARLPRSDPAGQGLFDDDAAAGQVSDDSADLRGAPRRRDADAIGYRLGSTMEFAGYDPTLESAPAARCCATGRAIISSEPYTEPVEEEWCGWRPMTHDSLPIIDRSPPTANVLIAAGHNMLGVSMSPATGKLVAELVDGQKAHVDPAPYREHGLAGCDGRGQAP